MKNKKLYCKCECYVVVAFFQHVRYVVFPHVIPRKGRWQFHFTGFNYVYRLLSFVSVSTCRQKNFPVSTRHNNIEVHTCESKNTPESESHHITYRHPSKLKLSHYQEYLQKLVSERSLILLKTIHQCCHGFLL